MTPSEMAARIRELQCDKHLGLFLTTNALEIASMLECFSGRTVSCGCGGEAAQNRLAEMNLAYNTGIEDAARLCESMDSGHGNGTYADAIFKLRREVSDGV